METIEKSVEVLNDLIEINNDRIKGFENASKDLEGDDSDLRAIFDQMAQQSRDNVSELSSAVNRAGGEAEHGGSGTGAIHRTWLNVKATFTGHDRKSVLEECERGEDAIKKAYQSALNDDNGLSSEFVQIISQQQNGIITSHDRIKALRDSQA